VVSGSRQNPRGREETRAPREHAIPDGGRTCRRIYPGPLGELVFRELSAYVEFGYRFGHDGLILRLADAVLATDPNPSDAST